MAPLLARVSQTSIHLSGENQTGLTNESVSFAIHRCTWRVTVRAAIRTKARHPPHMAEPEDGRIPQRGSHSMERGTRPEDQRTQCPLDSEKGSQPEQR